MEAPRHVAIIMDGNRRFAKEQGRPAFWGHKKGAEKLRDVLQWCKDAGVKELTLYTFSVQNFNRSEEEKKYLFDLFKQYFDKMINDKEFLKDINENKVKIVVAGRIKMFPDDVQERMKKIMDMTKEHDNLRLNFCMAYGGREELIDAFKKIIKKGLKEISEDLIKDNLWVNSDVDLAIRTSGEQRTSNFLPFQATYAEWVFVEHHWPGFTKEDFEHCLEEFSKRKRRFGK